jgi:F1F0 ATPase subunit 2
MSEGMLSALALFAGMVLGAIFFGGLWWTVLKGLTARKSALWFMASMLLRTAIALSGFYFVSAGDWKRMLACLLGFVLARLIVSRLTSTIMQQETGIKEAGHAPQ